MPRPSPKEITFTIDGLEVKATEGEMLVDAAKGGDVEIPVFCYEPKLGGPVGAMVKKFRGEFEQAIERAREGGPGELDHSDIDRPLTTGAQAA